MSEYIFKLPDLGEGTVESEIAEWFVKVGDQIKEEDLIGTMMTDKAAVELSSPVSGKVISLAGEPGDVIAVGAPLLVIETAASDAAENTTVADAPQATTAAALSTPATAAATAGTKVITSPAIRRRAKETGIDLAQVPGSGAGGRILPGDFDQYVQQQSSVATPVTSAADSDTEVKVIGLRRIIAERMTKANREIPHFTYVEEIDATELEALRQDLNQKNDEDQRLTLLPFIALALVRALREFPQCNTTYDKDRNVLIRHRAVHLGIATQTADGLKVPVVRNCETLSIHALSDEMVRVSNAARDNSIRKDELAGSTITITSLGKLAGVASTPIINMPEVAIIGVNRALERATVINGQVAIRLMMNLSSSFDHRFVDGYDGAAMIQRIKEMLEHPAIIFLQD